MNDAFMILDEAQNTTSEQMKMFLTRIGFNLARRDHGRRHPDRPATDSASGLVGSRSRSSEGSTGSASSTSTTRTSSATLSSRGSSRTYERAH